MSQPSKETELEHTKMSFGEHLEELRRALWKSILALMVGFLIGLCIGIPLVDYIQEPLRRALHDYHMRRAEAKQLAYLEQQRDAGVKVPEDLTKAAHEQVASGGVPHEYLVRTEELAASLEKRYPALAAALRQESPPPAAVPGGAADKSAAATASPGMITLRLYEPLAGDDRLNTISTSSFEPMVIYIKAALAAGLVIASPAIFYFIWEFVAAGLYQSERNYVHIYLPFSLTLFLIGAAIAYFFAFEYMLQFLFWFHEMMGIDPYPKLSDYITTVVLMPLGFGLSFQLPLVMLLLERIGIFTRANYLSKWRAAIVGIAILSMVATPGQDISSMMMMFIPLSGLYFLGIALCKYMPGGQFKSRRWRPPFETENQTGS